MITGGVDLKTGIYLRKSRAEELTDTTEETLKRHRETLNGFATLHKLMVVEIYEEVISGENLYTRTEMLRLLSDIEAGKLEAVLCMDIDRLGRGSMSQQGIILETFKTGNVKIMTPRKTYDLNNDLDEEYTEFQTFFARRELKTIKRRMRQGIYKSLQDGGYIANAPYGYENCRIGKLPSLSILTEEAEFVKLIFERYANQNYSCYAIAEQLNLLGAVPKRGAKFSRTTVKSILQNQVYIGKIVWNKRKHRKPDDKNDKHWSTLNPESEWILSEGLHPQIIDRLLFDKANEKLLGKYHPPCFNGKLTNPLAGIVTCAKCGGNMVRRSFNHGNIIYLMCPTPGCVKMTAFDEVENCILTAINEQLAELKLTAYAPRQESDNLVEKALLSSKKEFRIATLQKEKLYDFLEQGLYTQEVFLERAQAINDKLQKLAIIMKQLQSKLESNSQIQQKAACAKADSLFEAYACACVEEKNRLLKLMLEQVLYFKEKNWKASVFLLQITLKGL